MNCILVIKKKVSLVASTISAEVELQHLVESQLVDAYMSPELQQLINNKCQVLDIDIASANVFALGVIMLQMLLFISEQDLESNSSSAASQLRRWVSQVENELFQQLVSDMLIDVAELRLKLCEIGTKLYSFKSQV